MHTRRHLGNILLAVRNQAKVINQAQAPDRSRVVAQAAVVQAVSQAAVQVPNRATIVSQVAVQVPSQATIVTHHRRSLRLLRRSPSMIRRIMMILMTTQTMHGA